MGFFLFERKAEKSSSNEGIETVLRERPDLVLMDINMPGKTTGLEAAWQILAQYHVCIVMVTAYPDHQEEAEFIGACGYALQPLLAPIGFAALAPFRLDCHRARWPLTSCF